MFLSRFGLRLRRAVVSVRCLLPLRIDIDRVSHGGHGATEGAARLPRETQERETQKQKITKIAKKRSHDWYMRKQIFVIFVTFCSCVFSSSLLARETRNVETQK